MSWLAKRWSAASFNPRLKQKAPFPVQPGTLQTGASGTAHGASECRTLALLTSVSRPCLQGQKPTAAFLCDEGRIELVSLATRTVTGSLKMPGSVRAAAFSPDGEQLLSLGQCPAFFCWKIAMITNQLIFSHLHIGRPHARRRTAIGAAIARDTRLLPLQPAPSLRKTVHLCSWHQPCRLGRSGATLEREAPDPLLATSLLAT